MDCHISHAGVFDQRAASILTKRFIIFGCWNRNDRLAATRSFGSFRNFANAWPDLFECKRRKMELLKPKRCA
jgi:hypothetical protein